MSYTKRIDGRKFNETRPISAKTGVIKNADGSASFTIGNTTAYAAVYGPRNLYPKFLQNPSTGILRCNYNMMPFSGMGDRVRPGPSRRSKEISMVTQKALLPVLDLKDFPNAVVDVFIELVETDAGSRCAGICAASMALADAGVKMRDLVVAVSVGKVDDKVVVDLDYNEEAYKDGPVADIPLAIIPSTGEISLLQMDGEVTKEELIEALSEGQKIVAELYEVQKNALKERYSSKTVQE
ncbi:exosome complex exonuclease Rrp41 [Candidatus Woesearchaeota archaeon]|jgi:exosome complex component RRP41|nr:exosome complex exonuclease Rrp41 [Candidatus Woesearchaeota archaeon]MBT5272434.1 exosome complex exonuclease Rrp41 [Candidatus Woesearchaeota archaeon]MBT6337488.1 exosome complex exonuclease Rrp41 [Candidatus Woesearchaeota archaeon]MBT7928199.1 exosome complex exonuclease Rrp41 [Candidatus Woesearchaeota archaeon]